MEYPGSGVIEDRAKATTAGPVKPAQTPAQTAAAALAASRARDAIVVTDAQTRITWVNEAHERMTGHKLAEVIGRRPSEFLQGPGTDPARTAEIRHALRNAQPIMVELLNYHKDGHPFWVELHIEPVFGDDGTVTQFVSVQRDITERKRREQHLQHANDALRLASLDRSLLGSLLAKSEQEVYILDGQTLELQYVNRGACQALGFDRETLMARDPSLICADLDNATYTRMLRDFAANPERMVTFRSRHRRKDGSVYPCAVALHLQSREDGTPLILILCQDLSGMDQEHEDRLAAVRALSEDNFRLAMALEASSAGVFDRNLKTDTVYWSPRLRELLGFTDPAFQPESHTPFDYMHPEDAPRMRAAFKRVLAGKAVYDERFRWIGHPDGKQRWMRVRAQTTVDAEGMPDRMVGSVEDITAGMEARAALAATTQELQQTKEKLEAMLDGSLMGFWDLELATQTVTCSRRFCELVRLDPSQGVFTADDLWSMVHPDDYPRVRDAMERAVAGQGVFEVQYRVICADGSLIWVAVRGSLVRDREGNPTRFSGSLEDITQQMADRHERLMVERKFQLAFETAATAIALFDADTRIVEVNDAFCRIFDRPREELLGSLASDQSHPDDWDLTARFVEEMTAGKRTSYRVQKRFISGKGSIIWLDISVAKLVDEDGILVGYISQGMDITGRREAQDALMESRNTLHLALKASGLGIWDWNLEADETTYDQRAAQVLELPGAGVYRADLTKWAKRCHPQDRVASMAALSSIMSGDMPDFSIERRLLLENGQTRWVATHGMVVARNADGQPTRLVGTVADLSEVKALEQRLRETAIHARSADRAKSHFLATMSHELRTPMNGVLGMASLLAETPLEPLQKDYVRLIQEAGDHLMELLNDILDLSRVEAGKLVLESKPFTLCETLQRVQAVHQLKAQEKGITLIISRDPRVHDNRIGDLTRIQQILHNLVSNALKFTDEGSVSVALHPGDTPEDIRILVSDTGIGIRAEDQERLLEPFVQVESHLARRHGGAGLGLSIVRQLVDLMGGSLHLESNLGEGTTVTVSLPLPLVEESASAPVATKTPSVPPDVVLARPLRVLAVDDVALNLELIKAIMRQVPSVELVAVESAEKALAASAAEPFDLVLMDIQMPGMDGVEALIALRDQEETLGRPEVPVYAVTGDALKGAEEHYSAMGFARHFPKPLSIDGLRQALIEVAESPPNQHSSSASPSS